MRRYAVVFNEKFEDINLIILDEGIVLNLIILDEGIVLTEYKKEYSKPNPSVNVYIALFTTAHKNYMTY